MSLPKRVGHTLHDLVIVSGDSIPLLLTSIYICRSLFASSDITMPIPIHRESSRTIRSEANQDLGESSKTPRRAYRDVDGEVQAGLLIWQGKAVFSKTSRAIFTQLFLHKS